MWNEHRLLVIAAGCLISGFFAAFFNMLVPAMFLFLISGFMSVLEIIHSP